MGQSSVARDSPRVALGYLYLYPPENIHSATGQDNSVCKQGFLLEAACAMHAAIENAAEELVLVCLVTGLFFLTPAHLQHDESFPKAKPRGTECQSHVFCTAISTVILLARGLPSPPGRPGLFFLGAAATCSPSALGSPRLRLRETFVMLKVHQYI